MQKNIKTTVNLDLSNYVNIETGEILIDELNETLSIKVVKDTNLVLIDTKDYFITDSTALSIILEQKILSKIDLMKVLIMAKTLKTEFNATYNYNIPHTLETLSNLLEIPYAETSRLIKKLCRKNIMHRYITADKTLFCINPYLTRKRKHMDKDLLKLFSNFYK